MGSPNIWRGLSVSEGARMFGVKRGCSLRPERDAAKPRHAEVDASNELVPRLGLEPRYLPPEGSVLPLDDLGIDFLYFSAA